MSLDDWEPYDGFFGKCSRIARQDSVSVTIRQPPGDGPREVIVGMVGYPFDADDCRWLAGRLLEAAEAIAGPVTFSTLRAADANDAVQAAEDVMDDHHKHADDGDCFTGFQGVSMVERFLELGWRPPVTP